MTPASSAATQVISLKTLPGSVQVAYRFVAPLGLLCQLQCSRTLLSAQGVHSLPGGIVVHHTGLVGVIGRCGGHGQNSPGVYVQYDAHPRAAT